jgi:2-polyprenyl-6-methoxyphenol hydroxylase-like FAD-dependent oxidoreductase
MKLHRLNIGIIGGVAGAVALRRAGIHATAYKRANELRVVGAGMMLWPNATRVRKELGLLERLAALSGPNQLLLVRSGAGSILVVIGLCHFDVPALYTRRSDLLLRSALICGPLSMRPACEATPSMLQRSQRGGEGF